MLIRVLIFLLFLISKGIHSQSKLNYFYADTIFEYSNMKIDVKDAISYRDKFKAQLFFTNLSDSFKIIEPTAIKIFRDNNPICANMKNVFVIPPKCTRKFRLAFGDGNYKYDKIKTVFSKVKTTGKIESIYSPKALIITSSTTANIEQKQFPISSVGNLTLTLKSLKYTPEGKIKIKLNIAFSGKNFLGMHVLKIKIKTDDGKTALNNNQQTSSLYYKKEKSSMNITLEFDNPKGAINILNNAQLILDDVFVEYAVEENTTPFEFFISKKGEGKGNETKEEKEQEKDIEVIED